jgi:peroxiredoxin
MLLILDLIALTGILGTFLLVLLEGKQGVGATRRTNWAHLLLLAALAGSIVALSREPNGGRWGLLVLSASFYLLLIYWLVRLTRLPDARGLQVGAVLHEGTWRSASSGQLVPVRSVWGPDPALLILYRGPWCPYCRSELLRIRDLWRREGLEIPIVALSHEHPEPRLAPLQRDLGEGIELYQDPGGNWLRAHEAYHAGGHPSGRGGLAIPHLAWVDGHGRVLWKWKSGNYRRRLDPQQALRAGHEFGVLSRAQTR